MRHPFQKAFNIRRHEIIPVFLAVFYFFCVLTALMVLRPAREALGMQGGIDAVRWLFVGTAVITLAVNPVFGWLVSHLPRRLFITATYLFFSFTLLVFYSLMIKIKREKKGKSKLMRKREKLYLKMKCQK